MEYKYLIYTNLTDAENRCAQVTSNSSEGEMPNYVYADPVKHPLKDLWGVPIIPGYADYFTKHELVEADYLTADWYSPLEEDPVAYNRFTVEVALDKKVAEVLTEYWYRSIGEVAAMAVNAESKWQAEAIALNDWYNHIYEVLDDYREGTEVLTPEEFLATLPTFTYP